MPDYSGPRGLLTDVVNVNGGHVSWKSRRERSFDGGFNHKPSTKAVQLLIATVALLI